MAGANNVEDQTQVAVNRGVAVVNNGSSHGDNGGAVARRVGEGDQPVVHDAADAGAGSGKGVDQIPGSIIRAISQIMSVTGAVSKSQHNHHGNYKFASTDDIYATLTRKMGEVGLVILLTELSSEVVRIDTTDKDGKPKITQWLKVKYQFWLATDKDTWTHPTNVRTLFIQVTGPQTFQAAQSFAEKSYLRSLFKIPTGDLDLDAMPQSEFEDEQVTLATRKRKSSAQSKRDGSGEAFNALRTKIRDALTLNDLRELKTTHADAISEWPAQWADLIDDEFATRFDELRARAA